MGTGVRLDERVELDEEDRRALSAGLLEPQEDAQLQAALKLLG